jgi:hypothetical protein
MTSPTQLTLRQLRTDGWPLVAVVEHFNPHAHIRQDLFGIIDVLAVGPNGTLAIQATSTPHIAERVRKLAEHDNIAHIREAGWQIHVWGWHKKAGRWQVKQIDVS